MTSQETTYDEIPYPNAPLDYCHPRRLQAVAAMFGLKAPPMETARVLELGCGDGSNLLPQAELYPAARFVGVDLAPTQIDQGQAMAAASQLTNVQLRCADVMEIDRGWGEFDYIVAHGLFSWVPPRVRDALFHVLSENLSRSGVAYVSYNTLPGWHARTAVRDLMLQHAAHFDDPREKIRQARAILQWVADGAFGRDSYRSYLKEEIEMLSQKEDGYLYHEYLEENNDPFYFHQFVARATDAGLQYLGEADFHAMLPLDLPEKVREPVAEMPLEQAEQIMDFLRNRSFRRTLLCRREVQLDRNVGPQVLDRFQFCLASEVERLEVDLKDPEPLEMRVGGNTVKVAEPILQAAVAELCDTFPASVGLTELREAAERRLAESGVQDAGAQDGEMDFIAHFLWKLLTRGVIEFCVEPARFVAGVGPCPTVTLFVRRQAELGDYVTSRKHFQVQLDALSRRMIALLDGRNSRESIARQIAEEVASGTLTLPAHESPPPGEDGKSIEERVAMTLERLAKLALFVA